MTFRRYESRPITRLAYEIQESDVIEAIPDSNLYDITVAGQAITFVAHQEILPGDFIVYLNADDVYHCGRDVFLERNVVDEEEVA